MFAGRLDAHHCGVIVDQADLAQHLQDLGVLRLVACPLQAIGDKGNIRQIKFMAEE